MTRLSSTGVLALMALGCSSTGEPTPDPGNHAGVTILVTNGRCIGGSCAPLRVRAFPGIQPGTPGGLWSLNLGVITTPSACLSIPDSAHFYIIGRHLDGTEDTIVITWTSDSSMALSAQSPADDIIDPMPTTAPFIPDQAAGWKVTLPSRSRVTPGSACTL